MEPDNELLQNHTGNNEVVHNEGVDTGTDLVPDTIILAAGDKTNDYGGPPVPCPGVIPQ